MQLPSVFLLERQFTTRYCGGTKAEERPVGKVVMYGSVSVDGFIADGNDQPGPLFGSVHAQHSTCWRTPTWFSRATGCCT